MLRVYSHKLFFYSLIPILLITDQMDAYHIYLLLPCRPWMSNINHMSPASYHIRISYTFQTMENNACYCDNVQASDVKYVLYSLRPRDFKLYMVLSISFALLSDSKEMRLPTFPHNSLISSQPRKNTNYALITSLYCLHFIADLFIVLCLIQKHNY